MKCNEGIEITHKDIEECKCIADLVQLLVMSGTEFYFNDGVVTWMDECYPFRSESDGVSYNDPATGREYLYFSI
jgi:hypothetical protein